MTSKLDYLKKYASSDQDKPQKKKKAKTGAKPARAQGIIIVDNDALWKRGAVEEEEEETEKDAPVVIEDEEEKRRRRIALRQAKYGDTGGWVTVQGGGDVKPGSLSSDAARLQGQAVPGKMIPARENDWQRDSRAGQGVRHGSPDLSPPRKGRHASPDLSPPRKGRHDSPDLSPPRKGRHASPDLSPPRKGRHDSTDLSPPRKGRHDSPDLSPPRKGRHASPDLSPPRKGRHDSPDLSPPRKGRHDSPDLSPPRKGRHDSPDLSPPRKGRHDSPDLSPPRKGRHASPDLSPPRKGRHDSPDLSPPRKGRHDSPDLSPPRKRMQASPAAQLPRETVADAGGAGPARRKSRWQEDDTSGGSQKPQGHQGPTPPTAPVRMSDGTLAGLRTGKELAEEIQRTKEEERLRFQLMDPALTGRAHATVYRDKTGKQLPGPPGVQAGAGDKPADKPIAWGKGLVQKRAIEALVEEMEAEKAKPFARTRDDADLDRMLRSRTRFGDPMAHLMGNKGGAGDDFGHLVAPARSADELEGFCVPQEVPAHSWVRRGVAPPENRYGIRPGRHWDGVDRSNGFERNYFLTINQKKSLQDEAYQWSVADM
eukprot:jgi/Mesvir1/15922/Mv08246-RA.1